MRKALFTSLAASAALLSQTHASNLQHSCPSVLPYPAQPLLPELDVLALAQSSANSIIALPQEFVYSEPVSINELAQTEVTMKQLVDRIKVIEPKVQAFSREMLKGDNLANYQRKWHSYRIFQQDTVKTLAELVLEYVQLCQMIDGEREIMEFYWDDDKVKDRQDNDTLIKNDFLSKTSEADNQAALTEVTNIIRELPANVRELKDLATKQERQKNQKNFKAFAEALMQFIEDIQLLAKIEMELGQFYGMTYQIPHMRERIYYPLRGQTVQQGSYLLLAEPPSYTEMFFNGLYEGMDKSVDLIDLNPLNSQMNRLLLDFNRIVDDLKANHSPSAERNDLQKVFRGFIREMIKPEKSQNHGLLREFVSFQVSYVNVCLQLESVWTLKLFKNFAFHQTRSQMTTLNSDIEAVHKTAGSQKMRLANYAARDMKERVNDIKKHERLLKQEIEKKTRAKSIKEKADANGAYLESAFQIIAHIQVFLEFEMLATKRQFPELRYPGHEVESYISTFVGEPRD